MPSVLVCILNPFFASIILLAKVDLPVSEGPFMLKIQSFSFFKAVNIFIASTVVSKTPFFDKTN